MVHSRVFLCDTLLCLPRAKNPNSMWGKGAVENWQGSTKGSDSVLPNHRRLPQHNTKKIQGRCPTKSTAACLQPHGCLKQCGISTTAHTLKTPERSQTNQCSGKLTLHILLW